MKKIIFEKSSTYNLSKCYKLFSDIALAVTNCLQILQKGILENIKRSYKILSNEKGKYKNVKSNVFMFYVKHLFLIFSLVYHPQNFILIGFKPKGKIFFNLTHFHSLLQKSRKTFLFFSPTDFHFLTILKTPPFLPK